MAPYVRYVTFNFILIKIAVCVVIRQAVVNVNELKLRFNKTDRIMQRKQMNI
jgi:hypothetical protein